MKTLLTTGRKALACQALAIVTGVLLFKFILSPGAAVISLKLLNKLAPVFQIRGMSGSFVMIGILLDGFLMFFSGLIVGSLVALVSKGYEISRTYLGLLFCLLLYLITWHESGILTAFAETKSFLIFAPVTIFAICLILGGVMSATFIRNRRRLARSEGKIGDSS